jgi:hypothetical protein
MKRRFSLFHPDGFPEAQFKSFVAQSRVWRATIEATVANWEDLSMGRLGIPRPSYHFGEPKLSEDRTIASISVDGDLAPAAESALEPAVPEALYHDFPLWFRLDLKVARVQGESVPEWLPVIDPERARAIKESPLFKKG